MRNFRTATFLLHKSLLHFLLLLFAHPHHDLFEAGLHFLAVVLLLECLSLGPGVLDGLLKSEAVLGVRTQQSLDQV